MIDDSNRLKRFFEQESSGKFDGARANNRFGFQEAWSLGYLLREHLNLEDYLAVFDLHEDFVVFDSPNAPSKALFFQIKTKNTVAPWTVAQLTSKKKVKGSAEKRSYIEKLFSNEQSFSFLEVALFFVANGIFKVDLGDGAKEQHALEVRISTLSGKCKKKMSKAFGKTFPDDFSQIQRGTVLIGSGSSISQDARDHEIKGQLVNLLEKQFPNSYYRVDPIFLTLATEVTKKSRYELKISEESEIKHKSITKSELHEKLAGAIRLDSNLGWDHISKHLLNQGLTLGYLRNLSLGFAWIQNQIQNGSPTLESSGHQINLLIEGQVNHTTSLSDLINNIYHSIMNGPIQTDLTICDEHQIKGLIIYEYFKKR